MFEVWSHLESIRFFKFTKHHYIQLRRKSKWNMLGNGASDSKPLSTTSVVRNQDGIRKSYLRNDNQVKVLTSCGSYVVLQLKPAPTSTQTHIETTKSGKRSNPLTRFTWVPSEIDNSRSDELDFHASAKDRVLVPSAWKHKDGEKDSERWNQPNGHLLHHDRNTFCTWTWRLWEQTAHWNRMY